MKSSYSNWINSLFSLVLVFRLIILSENSLSATITPDVSTSIVISQIYGGADSVGSTYGSDYIELFNLGSTTVDLSTWSVQYAPATGSTWQKTNLTGTIQPGQYFLIKEATGSTGGAPIPTPDAIGTISMSASSAKVALVSNQTTLSGSCPAGTVDFVGYGSNANCYETTPTANASATTAALRAGSGCFDTDNNNVNFSIATPNPRNSSSPTYSCSNTLVINETDADTPGTDALEFIELYDGGVGNMSLNGMVVVLYSGAGDTSYAAYDLDNYTTDANGYFLLGNSGVPGVDLTFTNNTLQNGADAVALYQNNASNFPDGTAVTTANLIDAIVYDTSDPDDAGLLPLLNTGETQVDENNNSRSTADSNQRCPNGSGGARNTSAYIQNTSTPGVVNACSSATYASPSLDCLSNTPCYPTIQEATQYVRWSGQVYIYAGSYAENITLNRNITVNIMADIDIQGFDQTNGVFNAPSSTLTLTGNFNHTGGVFNHNNGTLRFAGLGDQSITSSTSLYNLAIENGHTTGNGVSLGNDLSILNMLTLNDGFLTLGGYHLTLESAASVGGTPSANSMVITNGSGELRKKFNDLGSFTFPVGDNMPPAEYSPATLNFTLGNMGTGAYAAVQVVDGKHILNPASTDYLTRYWVVTQQDISNFACDTLFNYQDTDIEGNEANILGAKYDGSNWYRMNPVNAGANTFGGSVVNFSVFSGMHSGVTAVWMSDTQVKPGSSGAVVTWQTLLETNLLGFNVYRSTSLNGPRQHLNNTPLATQGMGSPFGASYTFIDTTVLPGVTSYYWIEAIETNSVATLYGPLVLHQFQSYIPIIIHP